MEKSRVNAPKRIIDISVPNGPGQHFYPGDPEPRVESVRRIENGDVCNLSLLSMGSHTGTHVDAPYHFLKDGPRLGQVAMDRMVENHIDILFSGISARPVEARP